jgi:hypothetical protein
MLSFSNHDVVVKKRTTVHSVLFPCADMLQGQRQACRHTNHADMLQRWWKSAVTQQPGPSNKPQTILRPGLDERIKSRRRRRRRRKCPMIKQLKTKQNGMSFVEHD